MITCIRTDSDNEDFRNLVKALDADLDIRDGKEHAFYSQFNKIDQLRHVIVACDNELAVGCGAFKEYSRGTIEVKRMYTLVNRRGAGIASLVLKQLEMWGAELHYSTSRLETGKNQPEAIGMYQKNGYHIIPNYGQYIGIKNSVCFEKSIS